MNEIGRLHLYSITSALLRDGLRPGLARHLSGLQPMRLSALQRALIGAGHAAPRARGAVPTRLLTNLGRVFHASVLIECCDEVGRTAHKHVPMTTREAAIVFHASWLIYRSLREFLPFGGDMLDVNQAYTLFRDRGRLSVDPCAECGSMIARGDESPRGCPMCVHARRIGCARPGRTPLSLILGAGSDPGAVSHEAAAANSRSNLGLGKPRFVAAE